MSSVASSTATSTVRSRRGRRGVSGTRLFADRLEGGAKRLLNQTGKLDTLAPMELQVAVMSLSLLVVAACAAPQRPAPQRSDEATQNEVEVRAPDADANRISQQTCNLADADHDAIPDELDECPNEPGPPEANIDQYGCPSLAVLYPLRPQFVLYQLVFCPQPRGLVSKLPGVADLGERGHPERPVHLVGSYVAGGRIPDLDLESAQARVASIREELKHRGWPEDFVTSSFQQRPQPKGAATLSARTVAWCEVSGPDTPLPESAVPVEEVACNSDEECVLESLVHPLALPASCSWPIPFVRHRDEPDATARFGAAAVSASCCRDYPHLCSDHGLISGCHARCVQHRCMVAWHG